MEKIIGLDIGGSGTGFVVLDGRGRVFFRGAWRQTRWDDPGVIAEQVRELARFDAVGVAAAGVWTDEEKKRIGRVFRDCGRRVIVMSDAEAALLGAFEGHPGGVIIAGTGSVALGKGQGGGLVRLGGYGHMFGDKGGGFWIGRQAVAAALEALDGVGPDTVLRKIVEPRPRHFVLDLMGRNPTKRVAALAPLVIRAAEEGDTVAVAIVGRALAYLVRLGVALVEKLGLEPRLSYHGGLFGSRFFLERFSEMAAMESLTVQGPRHSPAWGAAMAGLGAFGD